MFVVPIGLAQERLAPFEQKYGVTSEHFISEMAAGSFSWSSADFSF